MPSGIGPNLILPEVANSGEHHRDASRSEQDSADAELVRHRPHGCGRPGPWITAASGGFTSYGPQGTAYQKPDFALGDPLGAGCNTALFGHTYNPAAGQSAYERFNDAGDSVPAPLRHRPLRPAGEHHRTFARAQRRVAFVPGSGRARPERKPALRLSVRYRQDPEPDSCSSSRAQTPG